MIIANNPLQVKSIQQWQESRLKEMELSSTSTSTSSTSSSLSTSSSSSFLKILPGPNHLWAIIAQEAGERFCYYGLRSVMTLFLVDVFLYSNAKYVRVNYYLSYYTLDKLNEYKTLEPETLDDWIKLNCLDYDI